MPAARRPNSRRAANPPTRQRAVRPHPRQRPPGAAAAKRRQRRRSARHRPQADRALLRLGPGRHAGCDRDDLLGRALLRLQRLPHADGDRPGLVARRNDRRVFARHGAVGCRRNRSRPMDGPPWWARVDDRRGMRWRRPGACLGVRQLIDVVLPGVGGNGRRVGDGPVRPRLRRHYRLVRSKACGRADRGDTDGRFCEHDFPAAFRVAGGSPGLASSTRLTCGHPGRRHHTGACAPASASTRRSGAPSRWPVRPPLWSRMHPDRRASRSEWPSATQHSAG